MSCRSVSSPDTALLSRTTGPAAAASIPMLTGAGHARSPLNFEIDRIVHLLDGNGLGDTRPAADDREAISEHLALTDADPARRWCRYRAAGATTSNLKGTP